MRPSLPSIGVRTPSTRDPRRNLVILYPSESSSISRSMSYGAQPSGSDMPPPFDGPNGQPQYLNEKERLRRHHESQDAAAMTAQSSAAADVSPSYTASPLYSPPAPHPTSTLSEKELPRRRFEEQDAAALAQQQPQPPPPRAVNGSRLPPPPVTPAASGFRLLTAAEEKAQLRAKYAAKEQQANGNTPASASNFTSHYPSQSSTVHSPPPPPPLMPRRLCVLDFHRQHLGYSSTSARSRHSALGCTTLAVLQHSGSPRHLPCRRRINFCTMNEHFNDLFLDFTS